MRAAKGRFEAAGLNVLIHRTQATISNPKTVLKRTKYASVRCGLTFSSSFGYDDIGIHTGHSQLGTVLCNMLNAVSGTAAPGCEPSTSTQPHLAGSSHSLRQAAQSSRQSGLHMLSTGRSAV